jgi:toxin ParE1/3/4
VTVAARFAPRARRDLHKAVRWITQDDPAAAQALRDAAVSAAGRIGAHPLSGVRRPDVAGEPYRFLMLTGFPYVIVYDAVRKPPLLVRVAHGARDLPATLKDL